MIMCKLCNQKYKTYYITQKKQKPAKMAGVGLGTKLKFWDSSFSAHLGSMFIKYLNRK